MMTKKGEEENMRNPLVAQHRANLDVYHEIRPVLVWRAGRLKMC